MTGDHDADCGCPHCEFLRFIDEPAETPREERSDAEPWTVALEAVAELRELFAEIEKRQPSLVSIIAWSRARERSVPGLPVRIPAPKQTRMRDARQRQRDKRASCKARSQRRVQIDMRGWRLHSRGSHWRPPPVAADDALSPLEERGGVGL